MFSWLTFGIPFVGVVVAVGWVLAHWSNQSHRVVAVAALVTLGATVLYPIAALLYVRLVGPELGFDIRLEGVGMLISLAGMVCTWLWLSRVRQLAALGLLLISVWMFLVWSVLASIAY
jgi:hypothetical protein